MRVTLTLSASRNSVATSNRVGKVEKSLGLRTCIVVRRTTNAKLRLSVIMTSSRTVGIGTTSITTMAMTMAGTPKSPIRCRRFTSRSGRRGTFLPALSSRAHRRRPGRTLVIGPRGRELKLAGLTERFGLTGRDDGVVQAGEQVLDQLTGTLG